MVNIPKIMQERYVTPVLIGLIKLYTTGALFLIAGGIALIVLRHPDGMDTIAVGFSILALGLTSLSGIQMFALTRLNFDEKMAMMTEYKHNFENMKDEKNKLEDIFKNRQIIENMVKNEKMVELNSMIENKKWINLRGIIITCNWLALKDYDNGLEKDFERVIERCGYDLSAISNLKYWAKKEKKGELITKVIGVITSANAIDTCGNNREGRCKIIKFGLEIDPENVDLRNCYKEDKCFNFQN